MASLPLLLETAFTAHYVLILVVFLPTAWHTWASYSKLADFKGPLLARFSSLWLTSAMSSKRANLQFYEVSQKYGDLARIGPNTLLTSDPEMIIRMSSARSRYTRSRWYSGQKLEVDHDNLFSTIDEATHSKKRAQLATGYSGKDIDGLEAMIDSHVIELMNLIRRKYLSDGSTFRPMDFARKSAFFTMDVITDIAFGRSWGCLIADDDVFKWFESLEIIMPNAIKASTIPWLSSLFDIPFLKKLVAPSEKDKIGPGKLIAVAKEIAQKRFAEENPGRHRDMMGSFIRHGINPTNAASEAILQIIAGGDTTATTIRATTLFVITNPQVYSTLQSEIDSSVTSGAIISDVEARQLPYLQAVIREGARMWVPATGLASKVVPPEGDTINGRFLPGGTLIGKSDWAIQRSKAIYGEDSTIFKPERWLEARGEPLEKMERTLGLIWGHGKNSCLGKNIAWIELNKVFFELFKNFDITIADPSNPWKSLNYGLWVQKDMFVKITQRKMSY
ncbi:cytochrome P450 [Mollisia scopiformis]|uniref:Cytochrome P450 n=1 Tax=Mollisia scopiformis TaxID=149040 RepID=A0A132BFD9_MOLSC|nr:cytochrome P450 [Mollisia scopiformis]KUJ10427.1 cytochrome P450 [Mollisia scopiformis]